MDNLTGMDCITTVNKKASGKKEKKSIGWFRSDASLQAFLSIL